VVVKVRERLPVKKRSYKNLDRENIDFEGIME
jgi:hypothetical protein